MSTTNKETIWRESASLIIVARNNEHSKHAYDYNVLMLKRSDQTALVPNQTVFPGGLFEAADESIEWMQYFEQFGITQSFFQTLLVTGDNRPKILAPQGNGCYDRFFKKSFIWAREISLRITAIRETFEEVGILLCRTKENLNNTTGFGNCRDDFDKTHWQQLVHNDSREFLNLCKTLQVVPDLWSLYEWSAWASPAPVKKGFETVFFIVNLNKTPNVLAESSEVKEYLWKNPAEILDLHRNGALWFLPPQMYELSRLLSIANIDKLQSFSLARGTMGITLYIPVGYICNDGMVSVYPGDDFYLSDPHAQKKFIPVELSVQEFRIKAKCVHRYEHFGMPNAVIRLNFSSPDGHLSPVNIKDAKTKL